MKWASAFFSQTLLMPTWSPPKPRRSQHVWMSTFAARAGAYVRSRRGRSTPVGSNCCWTRWDSGTKHWLHRRGDSEVPQIFRLFYGVQCVAISDRKDESTRGRDAGTDLRLTAAHIQGCYQGFWEGLMLMTRDRLRGSTYEYAELLTCVVTCR